MASEGAAPVSGHYSPWRRPNVYLTIVALYLLTLSAIAFAYYGYFVISVVPNDQNLVGNPALLLYTSFMLLIFTMFFPALGILSTIAAIFLLKGRRKGYTLSLIALMVWTLPVLAIISGFVVPYIAMSEIS